MLKNKTDVNLLLYQILKDVCYSSKSIFNCYNLGSEKNYNENNSLKSIHLNQNSDFFDNLIKELFSRENCNNFVLYGDKKVECPYTGNTIYLEIYFHHTNSLKEGHKLTFIFNDVTRTREIQDAEFKFKTIFLSKIAHELKNPLICMTELVNQLSELQENDCNNKTESKKIINQLNSMSNFLLILILSSRRFYRM